MAEPVNSMQIIIQAIADMDKVLQKNGWKRTGDIEIRQEINGYAIRIDIDTPDQF